MTEAKLKYKQRSFEIVEQGDYVLCAVSERKIPLDELRYWNVYLKEAYFSPIEVDKKFNEKF